MWEEYAEMSRRMPSCGMREVDKRPKFPAFLLTYSQTRLSVDCAFQELLKLRFYTTEVVLEKHFDGGEHIHALLICEKGRRRKLSPESCIIAGERPNIRGKGSKDVLTASMYIRKSYVDARGLRDLNERHCKWQRLLHQKTYDDAVRLWPGVDPQSYILNRINGEIGLRAHYEHQSEKFQSRYRLFDFNIPREIECWADSNIGKKDREGRSIILWGATRLGKTQLARCLGDHWYINADWDVNQVSGDVDYGIIDDIPVSLFRYWKQFLGCQEQFTVTDKFHKKKQLLWGKPVIWICNDNPVSWGLGINDMDWIRGNCDIVHVVNKLY